GYGEKDQQTLLGYGGDSNQKYVTSYFRRSFVVTNVSAIDVLTLGIVFDDGAAVYLNGVEVMRANLASSAGFGDVALSSESSLENLWQMYSIPKQSVRTGTNTMAVEVHRRSRSEGDLSFDLQLRGTLRKVDSVPPSPRVPVFDRLPERTADGRWILHI